MFTKEEKRLLFYILAACHEGLAWDADKKIYTDKGYLIINLTKEEKAAIITMISKLQGIKK